MPICIRGARQHNLKNIDVDIPHDQLVVITGPSGSGKSSLAFHTIYAEGQRRYVESLSSYARQFLEQIEKPEVDKVTGLRPSLAIDQKGGVNNPRSTIATVTEVYDYLRVLYAAAGVPHDPDTGERLEKMTSAEMVHSIASQPQRAKVVLIAVVQVIGDVSAIIEDMSRQGFIRAWYNEDFIELDSLQNEWREGDTHINVVVDRVVIKPGVESRLADSIETVLQISGGDAKALVMPPDKKSWDEFVFSTAYRNKKTGYEVGVLTPKHFSFNSHLGACPRCQGVGKESFCDKNLVVPDESLSIHGGAVKVWGGTKKKKGWMQLHVEALAEHLDVSKDIPFSELPDDFISALFYGTGSEKIEVLREKDGREIPWKKEFEGLCNTVERHYRESTSDSVKRSMAKYMTIRACSSCDGRRLKPEILNVKLENAACVSSSGAALSIDGLCALSIDKVVEWLDTIRFEESMREVCDQLVSEVRRRVSFMQRVGLGYLTLNRASNTLSGGEAQRIRLATQLGAGLSGVIYVLDEPSIGLHQQDNVMLVNTLKDLRDIGNTVIVVEHDEDTIREADWIIDVGPMAGQAGGELVAQGTPEDIIKDRRSVTGRWLKKKRHIVSTAKDEVLLGSSDAIIIVGATEHNLKNIDVRIPLHQMVCITGVSGSGKSTLINDILHHSLSRKLHGAKAAPGKHREITGAESVSKITIVDQSPIGQSPRSNPATYTGLLDQVRLIYAKLPLSKQRGYQAGRFSFNVKGGRCEKCQGDGAIRIDMQFLSDAYVTCDACNGHRYNRETLEVLYRGHSIADVLSMTASEACEFFQSIPKVHRILQALCDVGLGYIKLGQPANTLSGGESQRIKLASELGKPRSEHTLFIFDEPTTGLHFVDIAVLMDTFRALKEAGHSLVIIEHNIDLIASSDWVVDLGPGGGSQGGTVVAEGTPMDVSQNTASVTGQWLKKVMTDRC